MEKELKDRSYRVFRLYREQQGSIYLLKKGVSPVGFMFFMCKNE